MTRYDISIAYADTTPPWPGDTPYSCGWAWDMAQGASVTVGRVTTSWHVGTHADAPRHVSLSGHTSDALPLAAFSGHAVVLDASDANTGPSITTDWLSTALDGQRLPERLLLKTGCSIAAGVFPDAWPVLTAEAAAWLVRGGLRLFGVDTPSVDARTATDLVVHHALFGGGAYVLENLDLSRVPVGAYQLTAYPVLVTGADAAPVRAVLDALDS